MRRALPLAAGSPKFVQKGLCRRRSRLTRCQPRFHGEGLDGRTDGRTGGGNHKATMRRGGGDARERTHGGGGRRRRERRPRGCQCGLWKRVSKFNLTECRGVQPLPRTAPPALQHPGCIARCTSRGHLLCHLLRNGPAAGRCPSISRNREFARMLRLVRYLHVNCNCDEGRIYVEKNIYADARNGVRFARVYRNLSDQESVYAIKMQEFNRARTGASSFFSTKLPPLL